jgi:F1F0 ATPase subunit 2
MIRKTKMNEILIMTAVLVAGVLLGAFFFGGLWWTVRKGVTAKHPTLWFLGSSLFRTAVALAGFYLIARGDWKRAAVCLLGFVVARFVALRLTRRKPETNHAP